MGTELGRKNDDLDGFIIIQNEEDLPKHYYHEDKRVYLCINKSGKTMVCKYTKTGDLEPSWESASNWRNSLFEVVAYKRVQLPQAVLDLCTGAGSRRRTVEYLHGLK